MTPKYPCNKVAHAMRNEADNAMALMQPKSPYTLHVYPCYKCYPEGVFHIGRKNPKHRSRKHVLWQPEAAAEGDQKMRMKRLLHDKIISRVNITSDWNANSYHRCIITVKHTGPDIELLLSTAGRANKLMLFELADAKLLHNTLGKVIYEAEYFTGPTEREDLT